MTAWPSGLPYPRAAGAGRTANKSAARFETDAGPAKQRRTTTTGVERLDLSFRCTRSEADSLWDFYHGDAAEGGVWFDFTNPFNGVSGQARFLVGQEPKETPVPPRFEITIALEFMA